MIRLVNRSVREAITESLATQFGELIVLTRDQCFPLGTTPALHLLLPRERVVNVIVCLTVGKDHWTSTLRVLRALTDLVEPDPLFKVPTATYVKAAIRAFEDVHVRHGDRVQHSSAIHPTYMA